MRVKMIIVDLDRTLLRTDKTLSLYTAAVLKECKHQAIKLMAATARPLRAVKQYDEIIDFDALVVSNGARVICKDQRKEHGISPKSAAEILNFLKRHPALRVTLETGDCAYSNKPIADYETVIRDDLSGLAEKEGALKILVHMDSAETLAMVQNALTEDVYCTVANGYLMQIMSRAATKWQGIREVLHISDCSPDNAAYFGDDQDDIEPIKMCGMGIAVANGLDEVRAVADHIAKSNDEDGVANFIAQFILNQSPNAR